MLPPRVRETSLGAELLPGNHQGAAHAGSRHGRHRIHGHGAGPAPSGGGARSRGAGLQGRPAVRRAPGDGRRGRPGIGHRPCGRGSEHAWRGVRVPSRGGVPRAQRAQHLLRRSEREGTRNVLEAALAAGVWKFVYCSTCGVHGNVDHPPANEDAPIQPADYYQRTKYEAEPIVKQLGAGRMETVILRPAAIYGPGDPERFFMIFKRVARGTLPDVRQRPDALSPALHRQSGRRLHAVPRAGRRATGANTSSPTSTTIPIEEIVKAVGRALDVNAAHPPLPRHAGRRRRAHLREDLQAVRHHAADLSSAGRLVPAESGVRHQPGQARAGLRPANRAGRGAAPHRSLVPRAGVSQGGSGKLPEVSPA